MVKKAHLSNIATKQLTRKKMKNSNNNYYCSNKQFLDDSPILAAVSTNGCENALQRASPKADKIYNYG